MSSFFFTVIVGATILGLFVGFTSWQRHKARLKAPRISAAELDALQSRLEAAKLPVVRVSLSPEPPYTAYGSRVGGPAFADNKSRKWPVRGKDRLPMLFLAQINFAEMPPIDDFPGKGLLQVFALADARGQLQGTDRKTDRVIRWYPDPVGDLTLSPPEALMRKSKWATFSVRTVRDGLSMTFGYGEAYANPYNWPYIYQMPDRFGRLPENEEVQKLLEAWQKAIDGALEKQAAEHWIGGHPRFVQNDVREEPRLRKLNRVLLHLGSDDIDISLGDVGELNLMISRKDLRDRNFDEAFCTWDCS